MNREQLLGVAAILKRKFNNLTVEEVIDLATRIVEAVEERYPKDIPLPPK